MVKRFGLFTAMLLAMVINVDPLNDKSISARYGVVRVNGYSNCAISSNGNDYTCSNCDKVPGYWFGLIHYKCDDISGSVFSKVECKDCGLFCRYNEMINGCEQSQSLFWIGCFVGFLAALSLVYPVIILSRKMTSWMSKQSHYYNTKTKDKKAQLEAEKINKMTGMATKPILEEYSEKRLGKKRSGKMNRNRFFLALTLMVTLAKADDMTYYINSVGKYCTGDGCVQKASAVVQLLTGSTININNNGEETKITLESTDVVVTYVPIYRTGSFELDVIHASNCKNAGDCAAGTCHNDYIYDKLKFHDKCQIINSGCDPSSLGNPEWLGCTHHRLCVWYKYCINKPKVTYTVYKAIKEVKTVKLLINSKTIKSVIEVTDESPQHNVYDSVKSNSFSVQLLSTVGPDPIYKKSGLIISDVFYMVEASEYNSPEVYKIGDYQMDLSDESAIYPINYINCFATNVSAKCTTPEPYINILTKSLHNYRMHNDYIKHPMSLEVPLKWKFTPSFMVSGINFDNLLVRDAVCKVNVYDTFSCEGCVDYNYIAIKSSAIKTYGLMKFTSNCSFSTNLIPCQESAFILRYSNFNEYCELMFEKTNQSLVVVNNMTVKSRLSELYLKSYESSYLSEMKDAVSNTSFLTGLSYTIAGTTLVTTVLTMIYRLAQIYVVRKSQDIK